MVIPRRIELLLPG